MKVIFVCVYLILTFQINHQKSEFDNFIQDFQLCNYVWSFLPTSIDYCDPFPLSILAKVQFSLIWVLLVSAQLPPDLNLVSVLNLNLSQ